MVQKNRITDADETLKGKTMFASLHTATLATRHVRSGRADTVGSLTRLVRSATHAYAAYRQRQTLANLDAFALADIGLTRADALTEAAKPIWDVPQHWKR